MKSGERKANVGILTWDMQPFTEDLLFRISLGIPEITVKAYPCFYHPNQSRSRVPVFPSKIVPKALGVMKTDLREQLTPSVNFAAAIRVVKGSDIVVLYGLQGGTALIVSIYCKILGKKLISVNHSVAPNMELKRSWWVLFLKRLLFRQCDFHICQMPAAMETLQIVYGIDKKRMNLAPFEGGAALYIPKVVNAVDRRRRTRDKFRFLNSDIVYLMVGSLIPVKGPDLFIRAFSQIHEKSAKGIIVGPEEPGYGKSGTIAFYKQIALELGVSNRIHICGRVDAEELADLYSAADVFVLPSWKDCLPKVFIEAALFNLPIITTEAAGSIGLLPANEISGLIVPVGDDQALAGAMRNLADETLRHSYGKQAFQTVIDFCVGEKEISGFRQAITSVCDNTI